MKIIDEKGKVFGKINIIDLLIILVVVAALAAVGINFLRGNTSVNQDLITMEFYAEEVTDYVAKNVKVGSVLYDDTENITLGTVTEIKTGPSEGWISTSDGRFVKATKTNYKSIKIKGEVYGVKTDIGATVQDVKYGVGHSMTLRAGDAKIYLKVSDIKLKEKGNAGK